ncbi:MAG: DUF2000 family protein [Deinococcus-Thermus bacterium]|jgi:hypothetical protein|nr:DUF2000 family protein [Deinococcota bacterium]
MIPETKIPETKIAVVLRDDLAAWQKLNVTAFLAGGLVGAEPALAGQPYRDADGRGYRPLIRQPVLILAAPDRAAMDRAFNRALERNVIPAVYTAELFATGNDIDNRAAVAAVPTEALDLVGLALHAERKTVDKILKGLKLHG